MLILVTVLFLARREGGDAPILEGTKRPTESPSHIKIANPLSEDVRRWAMVLPAPCIDCNLQHNFINSIHRHPYRGRPTKMSGSTIAMAVQAHCTQHAALLRDLRQVCLAEPERILTPEPYADLC